MTLTPHLPSGYNLTYLERTGSTNSVLLERAKEGAKNGEIVWAGSQTSGRGRSGREWTSPEKGLYASLLIKQNLSAEDAALCSFVTALAVHDALSILFPTLNIGLKWPNDILVTNNEMGGKKLGGILLESISAGGNTVDALVIGFGINIKGHPGNAAWPATSLAEQGVELEAGALLEAIVKAFDVRFTAFHEQGATPMLNAWLQRALFKGEMITINAMGEKQHGVFERLDEKGGLVLKKADGTLTTITAGEIFFGTTEGLSHAAGY